MEPVDLVKIVGLWAGVSLAIGFIAVVWTFLFIALYVFLKGFLEGLRKKSQGPKPPAPKREGRDL